MIKKITLKNLFYTVLIVFLFIKAIYIFLAFTGENYVLKNILNNGDAGHYYKIAQSIFEYGTFTDNNSDIPTESATWRPPIWPFVISMFFYISKIPIFLILFKSLLELGLILFSLKLFFERIKFSYLPAILFLLLLIEPQYLKYSITFLSESVSAVLILLSSILFITNKNPKKLSLFFPLILVVSLLCHPITVFFIIILFGFYTLLNYKENFKTIFLQSLLFVFLLSLWPIRNLYTFNKGIYLTASQGATVSKGWNEKVITNFNNVDGDLADETINLKFVNPLLISPNNSVLENSKLYKQGTYYFLSQSKFIVLIKIASKKIISNFIPYPEKPKNVLIEKLAIPFRIFYLIIFLQAIYGLTKTKFQSCNSLDLKLRLVIIAIFLGQIFMSIYIYTGLRFNSVYGLTLLFSGIALNLNLVNKLKNKIIKIGRS